MDRLELVGVRRASDAHAYPHSHSLDEVSGDAYARSADGVSVPTGHAVLLTSSLRLLTPFAPRGVPINRRADPIDGSVPRDGAT